MVMGKLKGEKLKNVLIRFTKGANGMAGRRVMIRHDDFVQLFRGENGEISYAMEMLQLHKHSTFTT